ncbi:MAG TPA: hypothetical protein VFB33_01460 [Candidatus Binataceae bacterium]|jgi:hypothetical protein|nr:hypothetical protein [Candidatus Binataceae bacterium]
MTESHLRRLSVTLRILEDALLDIEAGLADPPRLAMTIYEDDVPHALRAPIRERVRQLRDEILKVKERYALAPQVLSNRRRISTKLSLLSINLTEATARYMRAYGEVTPEEQGPLDTQVMKLIDIVDELNAVVNGRQRT